MRGGRDIDWKALVTGIVAYEQPFAALDGERFERIERGFGAYYQVDRLSSDAFGFSRGEGYTRLPRWDAFGYVDSGTVTRVRNAATEVPDYGANIAVLPAGWKAIQFRLNIRVILIIWAALIAGVRVFAVSDGAVWMWVAGFVAIAIAHVLLVMRSLDEKLKRWMARSTWN